MSTALLEPPSRWAWSRWRSFVMGALGMLCILAVVLCLVGVWILWIRAYHGQMAYETLLQLQQQQLQAHPPAKPGG